MVGISQLLDSVTVGTVVERTSIAGRGEECLGALTCPGDDTCRCCRAPSHSASSERNKTWRHNIAKVKPRVKAT